jgi:two-component system OmpR family sensor kinase
VRWKLLVTLVPAGLVAAGLVVREWTVQVRRQSLARANAEAEEERRHFLRRLDHELKNPLTAIQVGLANLAEAHTEEDRRASLASVQAQVERIASLTGSLRKLAELETRAIERAPVDLVELLQTAVALARERPEAASRKLTLTLPQPVSPLITIQGDEDLLLLALYNLLDNALKFGRPGDLVEVRAFVEEEAIVIQVADTGCGIPEAEVPHVWEELYRGRAAQGISGSGLGLGLVRTIADRHGGHVNLRSQIGEGTVVTMCLPVE